MLALRKDLRDPQTLKVHLLNVQRPVSGDVSSFINNRSLDEYYAELSDEAMAPAKAVLQAAGLQAESHRRVGPPGATIAEMARSQDCGLIVMGARGLGAAGAALLGSATQETIANSAVPVLVVK